MRMRAQEPPLDLAIVWERLTKGELRITRDASTAERHYLIFRVVAPHEARPIDASWLESLLLGEASKVTALDENVSLSTVSFRLGNCLAQMGLPRRSSRVPLLLVVLARAKSRGSSPRSVVAFRVDHQVVLSMERPDACLSLVLSPAEAAVARLFVEGETHAGIALRRGVSQRTVANQLASAFRKIGVHCRLEFIAWMLSELSGGATHTIMPSRDVSHDRVVA